jgi:peptide/nickel transport system permease protein
VTTVPDQFPREAEEAPPDTAAIETSMAVTHRRGTVMKRFLSNKLAVVAAVVLLVLTLVAVFAPWIVPHDPNQQDITNRLKGPGEVGVLGTDDFGRDVLSRLMMGARVSLGAAAEATIIAVAVGVPLGLLAGFRGGWADSVSSRIFDGVMSLPFLILALTGISIVGRGLGKAMAIVGIVLAPSFFRVARAVAQSVGSETFIEASTAIGCRTSTTLFRHVLPNSLSPLLVQTAVTMGIGVSAEASLSFLGLGANPPTASWGSMLRTALQNVRLAPHLAWLPGLAITITVLALTLFGDGLRDAVGTRRLTKKRP